MANSMFHAGIILSCLYILVTAKDCYLKGTPNSHDVNLCVPELIKKYGYPVEIHNNITTADGYILTAHRIPNSPKCKEIKRRGAVYLQHGLLGDSSNWVTQRPEKALAYNLADECYDVWMGNHRGNTYSRRHKTLNPDWNMKKFWDFSWHELGSYDLPATIDYILRQTGEDALFYIGHSMGTTAFWVLMSEKPEYNSKVRLMTALAPVTYINWTLSPVRLLAPISNNLKAIGAMLGIHEILASGPLMQFFAKVICHEKSLIQPLCSSILFLAGGYNTDQLDTSLLPLIFSNFPAGSSAKSFVHYGQGINTGKFRQYNYGLFKNLIRYGSYQPKDYKLENVKCPVALYWGRNDWLAAEKDVKQLIDRLPNLVRNYALDHPKYSHFDFLWAKDNVELLNKKVIEFMKKY